MDHLLAAQPDVHGALAQALALDPDFALAHAAAARVHQLHGRGIEARAAIQRALACAEPLTRREHDHVHALAKVVAGDGAGALQAIRLHLARHPRDALVLLPCVGVFGLFGFSGREGRERELAAFLAPLATHYPDDWWFLSVLAFAQVEAGEPAVARPNIDRAMALNPLNANGAHIRAHVHYEAGEDEAGLDWLLRWHAGYDKAGLMHCHLAWHIALWQLDLGHVDDAWRTYDAHIHPGGAWGPPLNVVTDAASFLFRAELAGAPRAEARWKEVAAYARTAYPSPGLTFADAHIALALAMTGEHSALARLTADARGPGADLLPLLARGFAAFAAGRWTDAEPALGAACAVHERLGGSRAQRDLFEYAWLVAAHRAGRPVPRNRTRPLPRTLAGRLSGA